MKKKSNEKSKKQDILIVEDSPTQSLKLKQLLVDKGYSIRLATNGSEALLQVKKQLPDLILSDIMMPVMDGYEMAGTLKSNPEYEKIPIILLTMLVESEDILKSLECGADMYISKPYDNNYLLRHVELLLSNQPEIHASEMKSGEFEITYYHKKYKVKAEFFKVINLLFSTYETAVSKNKELTDAQNELIKLNNNLEELVNQRTAALLDEIAERKIVERELRKSEEKYRTLLDTLQEGIWVIDSNDITTFVNDIMPAMLGYTKKEMFGKSIFDFIDVRKTEYVKNQIDRHKEGIYEQIEYEFVKKDGTRIQTILETGPIFDDKGNYNGTIAGVIDISERKKHEEQLNNLNIVLKAIRNVNQLIVREKDKSALIRQACNLLVETGSFRHAFISLFDESMKLIDFTYSGDVPNHNKIRESLQKGDYPLCYKDALANPDKISTKHPIRDCKGCDFFENKSLNDTKSLTSILFFEGKTYGFITISVFEYFIEIEEGFRILEEVIGDISYALHHFDIEEKRRKAEEYIRWQEKYFENLLENANVWLDAIDSDGKLVFWNKKAEEISGFKKELLLGNSRKWKLMYPEGNKADELLEFCRNIIKNGEIIKDIETEINTADGEKRIIAWSSNLIKEEDGQVSGSMFVGEDLTERKKAETDLIAAKERAEEMNRLKTSFLANMSHELRTPMNGILGFSEILQLEDQLEIVREIASVINKSGKRLMNTLNSILNLSRVEAGELKPQKEIVNLIDVAFNTVELFRIEAEKKKIDLNMESEFESLLVLTDERMINDSLNNLVNNAIKFTNEGSVTVKVSKEITDKQEWVIIDIIDTGIGIDEKDFNTIFDEFRQVSEGLSRSFEGTGLGLTICKRYIHFLGGTIDVKSKLNVGSTFTIKLPYLKDSKSDSANSDQLDKKQSQNIPITKVLTEKKKLLYVEDDDVSIKLLEILTKDKYLIDVARKAKEAIEKAKTNLYNMILMDINLGKGESGIDATREIRKLDNYKKIPIIAVTAFAMYGDREEFINCGCDDYISKPYNQNELLEIIDRYLSKDK